MNLAPALDGPVTDVHNRLLKVETEAADES